jgi:hypothetical protein
MLPAIYLKSLPLLQKEFEKYEVKKRRSGHITSASAHNCVISFGKAVTVLDLK